MSQSIPAESAAVSLDDLLDFTRPEFRRDPVPTYHRLREQAPIASVARGAVESIASGHVAAIHCAAS